MIIKHKVPPSVSGEISLRRPDLLGERERERDSKLYDAATSLPRIHHQLSLATSSPSRIASTNIWLGWLAK